MRPGFPFRGTRRRLPLRLRALLPVFSLTLVPTLVEPPAVAAATLTGRVTDPDGRAVPNARVIVSGPLGPVAETRSGPSGDYQLSDLPDGRYDVRVLAPGFSAPATAIDLAGDERRAVGVQLALSAVEEAIVVSASQIAVARSEAPASVTVITAADLAARQVETVADALRDVPGLAVTRSGGRGALTSIFPRGGSSNYTLVLVDGVRTNTFGGAFDFAHLSVANVDRIEIVRGPQSALYGSEAIGAVVQVFTKQGGAPTLAAWCASEQWKESGGKYVPSAANWVKNGGFKNQPPAAAESKGGKAKTLFGSGTSTAAKATKERANVRRVRID